MIDRIAVSVLTTRARIGDWLRDQRGQDLLEYAMLGGLLVVAILAVIGVFSGALGSMINGIKNCIDFDSGTKCTAPF